MLPLSIEIRTKGLEPSRSYPLEPETSASTNSATCAFIGARGLNHNFTRQASKICKKWHFSFLREKTASDTLPRGEDASLRVGEKTFHPRHGDEEAC